MFECHYELQAELLMRVHHRNLVAFVGYCYEGTNLGIIYEYMACGNLAECLSGTNHIYFKAFPTSCITFWQEFH